MNAKITALIERWSPTFAHLLLHPSGRFVAFGDDKFDDMVVVGSHSIRASKPRLISHGILSSATSEECEDLFRKTMVWTDNGTLASFNVSLSEANLIREAAKKLLATHIRFSNCPNGVTVTMFDLRRFLSDYRIARKYEVMLVKHFFQTVNPRPFDSTLLMQSFLAIKERGFSVEIAPNRIVRINPFDGDHTYLLHDQKAIDPVMTSPSDRLGQGISLLLQPKLA